MTHLSHESMKGISALQYRTHPNPIIQVLLGVFIHEGLQGVRYSICNSVGEEA